MPNRIIKESICSSETIDGLSWFEEVFFYRLIVNCDDFGRFDARPAVLKARLFPLKERITLKDVSGALRKLVDMGIVRLYECDSKPYLYLPTWKVHQTPRATKSKFPEPCDNMKSSEISCNQMKSDAPDIRYSIFDNRYSIFDNRESKSENDTDAPASDASLRQNIQRVVEAWNGIAGIAKIERINSGSKRYQCLKARLDEYGVDKVLEAIEKVKESDFLRGKSRKGWVITFDWFVLPNNFPKVLEGNYENREVSEYGIFGRPDPGEAQGERQELPGVVVL